VTVSGVDADLSALASPQAAALASRLHRLFREIQFDQVNHDLRLPQYGGDYEIRPFPLPASPVNLLEMKVRLRNAVKAAATEDDRRFAKRLRRAFSFFMFGETQTADLLLELFGNERDALIESAIALGLCRDEGKTGIRMNGLSLFSTRLPNGEVIYVFADTPPHFANRMAPPRVYAGADSYELMKRVAQVESMPLCCLELGSGSGVQLIALLKTHTQVAMAIGKERDARAIHVSRFNAHLNGVANRVRIVSDDREIESALGGYTAEFAMTNPPFLAVPAWIDLDATDAAVVLTFTHVRATSDRLQADIRGLFPDAGWGGDDGLDITKEFIKTMASQLAPGAKAIVYSQFAGDSGGPSLVGQFVSSLEAFEWSFRPTGRPAVYTADETARSIARLIVAAALAKREPSKLRLAIRSGPEHELMLKLARRIADSYQCNHITHFHDGFLELTRKSK
jgi:methylase of polypeptide subunit release factors